MFRLMNKCKNKKGFTLIELIVVLAVLGIIAAIAVPKYLNVQEQSREKADEQTVAMIEHAAELYFAQMEQLSASGKTVDVSDLVDSGFVKAPEFQSQKYIKSGYTNGTLEVTVNASGEVTLVEPKK